MPGGKIAYQFTVERVGKGCATCQFETPNDTLDWLVSVCVPPAFIGANGRIQLGAGDAMIVTVTAGAPVDAAVGAVAVATLNVIDLR